MKSYRHVSLEERELFFLHKHQGMSLRTIARKLNRSHSTLVRELKRNLRANGTYMPCTADAIAWDRLHQQRREAPLKNRFINEYVKEKLELLWSPETIAGRLKQDHPHQSIVHETIYQFIYGSAQKDLKLWQYLTLRRKKRMRKKGRHVRVLRASTRILSPLSIENRPQEVQKREVIGHWETDNVVGRMSDREVISATVERTTRFTILTKVKGNKAQEKFNALVDRLQAFPPHLRRSLTTDNGCENAYHERLTRTLSMPVYFCHSYCAWEKGTVENMNGRLRRYLPKGHSLRGLTDEEIAHVEESLNSTPRKCLGYKTPSEMMSDALQGLSPTL